jgi:hypothetical protein
MGYVTDEMKNAQKILITKLKKKDKLGNFECVFVIISK